MYPDSFLLQPCDLCLETICSNITKLKGKSLFVAVHRELPLEAQNKVKKIGEGYMKGQMGMTNTSVN